MKRDNSPKPSRVEAIASRTGLQNSQPMSSPSIVADGDAVPSPVALDVSAPVSPTAGGGSSSSQSSGTQPLPTPGSYALAAAAAYPDVLSQLEKMSKEDIDKRDFDKAAMQYVKDQDDRRKAQALLDLSETEKAFQLAAMTGDVPTRTMVDTRFRRDVGKSDAYKQLKGWEQKRKFRAAWAGQQFDSMLEKRVRRTTLSEKWKKQGQYVSFRKIWEEEGMDDAGFNAAKRYVESCLRLGGEFLRHNAMTSRIDFLYIRVSKTEAYEELFQMTTQELI